MTVSDEPKMVRKFVDDGVETFETQVEGETIQWDRGLTYSRHLQIHQLLSAQIPVSDKPDELLFIIMHQTMELWLKLVLHEVRLVIDWLKTDELSKACKALDRVAAIQRHMIDSWEVLATLTPHDYLTFRGYLRRASGFQSYQYRQLEFLLGNKREALLVFHREDETAHSLLSEALREPSLYDELLRLLARRGFSIPPSHLERDWTQPYTPSEQIEDAWIAVYSDVEVHWDLYMLAEKITGLEYYFQEWRFKHMKTVSRVIGQKMGTAGSSGVNYLVKALDISFFPELWSMRTRLTTPKIEADYARGSPEGEP